MKLYAAALILAAAIILTACGPTQEVNNIDPFIGGTQGLKLSFLSGAPPTEVFDAGQMPFTASVVVENLGESDVGSQPLNSNNVYAVVQLVGINPAQLGYPELEKSFMQEDITVEGARKNFDGTIISGAPNYIDFESFCYQPDEPGNTQRVLRANICYDYSTRTTTLVCIKDNILENAQDSSICTISGQKDVKNSGAPVHVTTVTQQPGGRDKIQVLFTIENVGTGQIFRRSGLQGFGATGYACDTAITNVDRDWVYVRVDLGDEFASAGISCSQFGGSNEGEVRLFSGGAATIACTIPIEPGSGRVYTDNLRVNLEYTYLEWIETPILIKDVPGANEPVC